MSKLTARPIATGVGFTEGPVIRPDGEIVFVSFTQQRLYRINGGKTSVLAELPGGPNGATEDLDGTIYVTQSGGRAKLNKNIDWSLISGIQAVSREGAVRWISTDPISPNDLCIGPDGWLWATDPSRFHDPRDDGRLFRINPKTGEAVLACSLPWYPNGIGFGPEDDALYVAKCGPDFGIMRFPLDGGRLGKPEAWNHMDTHSPDGFLFDVEGNLVTAAISKLGDGPGEIQTYDRNGKLVDRFVPGPDKSYTNVALGPDRKLIVTASHGGAVLEVDGWPHAGLPLHPFRKAKAG